MHDAICIDSFVWRVGEGFYFRAVKKFHFSGVPVNDRVDSLELGESKDDVV